MEQSIGSRVFIDTNFFVTIHKLDDALHDQAMELSEAIEEQKLEMVFSNYVLLEILTVLSQQAGREKAIRAGEEFLSPQSPLRYVHVDKRLNEATWAIFQEVENKNVSFVDCSIVAVMQHEQINKVITFDKTDFVPLQRIYEFEIYN